MFFSIPACVFDIFLPHGWQGLEAKGLSPVHLCFPGNCHVVVLWLELSETMNYESTFFDLRRCLLFFFFFFK